MNIIFAIIIFSFLIFIHEFGHFFTAKLSGVQVNEFAIFMGPAIWKKKKGETLYSIRCIPIGGYCAMEGEDQDTDNPRSFQKAAWWKRLIILAAGSVMNFLAGLLLFAIVILPMDRLSKPVITDFRECCIFHSAETLQLGDEIIELDGEIIYDFSDVNLLLNLNQSGVHDVTVLRDGQKIHFEDLQMTHNCTDENGEPIIHYGFQYGQAYEPTFLEKLGHVGSITVSNIRNVRLSIVALITGQAGLSDMMGPVGMVGVMNDIANASPTWVDGLMNILHFGAIIAVNLAIMNLLPIPALDGGRIVALLLTTVIVKISGKPINPKYEAYIHGAGMVLLLLLMAVVMFNDIFAIFTR